MLDLHAVLAEVLQVNRSAMPRLLEAFARGGIQGGAPEGDPPVPAPAAPPAAPAPAPAPAPVVAAPSPVGPDILSYYNTTIGTLTSSLEALKASGAAKDKDLKAAQEALANFTKLEGARADSIFAALPEGSRKKLEPFKAQVPQQVWIALLGAEQAVSGAPAPAAPAPGAPPKPSPPPTGSPIGGPQVDEYELSERSRQIIEQFPNSDRLLARMKTMKTESIPDLRGEPSGALKFLQPVKTMIRNMSMGRRIALTKENAPQR